MRSPRWLGALGVLVVYTLTMCRDLSLFDSPELALVATELGLGHPPGQPLYTLIGFAFAHLPGVPPLVGLNFLSALAGALTVVPASRIAEVLGGGTQSRAQQLLLVTMIALGAMHPVLWEPATRVEVYSLATLLAVWGLERVQRALHPSASHAGPHSLIVGALLLGLSASVNPITALACTFAVTPAVVSAIIQRRVPIKVAATSIAAGLVGLLPYLYVPLVANRTDALVWGAPSNTHDLINYFLGGDYAHNTGITPSEWLAHVGEWVMASNVRFGLPWLLVGATFHIANGRRTGLGAVPAVTLLLISVAFVCANKVFRIDNPDYHGYLAAAFWLCLAGVAAGIVIVWTRALRVALLMLALAIVSTVALMPRTRSGDHVVRELVEPALRDAPPNAIVIVESDHWIAPLLYLQRVEKLRPDVVVVGAGLTASSWYWGMIYRDHPDLFPFGLRAPGGRDARMRRFVQAHADRPLLLEHTELGARLGIATCPAGALLRTRFCTREIAQEAHGFALALARQLDRSHPHVPLAAELIAMIAVQRGEDLWRLNAPNAALHTLLAGVPNALRQPLAIDWPGVSHAPPLRRPPIAWQQLRVLGDPARNLYVAAELLFRAGQRDAAQTLATSAGREGLTETRQ